jgi:hypothetical protein
MYFQLRILFIYYLAKIVFSYDAILEGFYNSILPGGPGDTRGLPNVPFTTDTNRLSDGTTSASIFDATSPPFPLYNGSLANTSNRYEFYAAYTESAAEQGIGVFGASDATKEDAKVKILKLKNYLELPPPNKTFPVYAAIKWNPSNFAIQEGEHYRVEVLGSHTGYGSQFWYDGGLRIDAAGYDSYFDATSNCYVALGRCRPHLAKRRRNPSANWMALHCAIGEFVRPLAIVAPGEEQAARYLPLDESRLQETIFSIGYSFQFRANDTGQLICFANDAHALYWNNKGKLDVTVTRVSWPPTNTTYYQALYLEACDSARSIYVSQGNYSKVECNPNGGGSGWDLADVLNTVTKYSSGMPDNYQDPHENEH